MDITHLNPEGLSQNPAFSQAVVVRGMSALVVVGGQNGVGPDGELVGPDIASQSKRAMQNVLTALEAAGASQSQVIKLSIYMVTGEDLREAYAASQEVWGTHPTPVTVLMVAALGRPGVLVEVEALAAL